MLIKFFYWFKIKIKRRKEEIRERRSLSLIFIDCIISHVELGLFSLKFKWIFILYFNVYFLEFIDLRSTNSIKKLTLSEQKGKFQYNNNLKL